jgi:ABC-type multidrug transport system fused ATPase/permease subunit
MKIFQSILAVMCLGLASCCTCPKPDDADIGTGTSAIPTIENLGKKIDEQAANIQKETATIKEAGTKLEDNLKSIQDEFQDPKKKDMVTDSIVLVNDVQNSAEHIDGVTAQIDKDTNTLTGVAVTIRDLEAKAAALHEAEQKAKEEALKRLYAFIATFWVIGFVVIVGGIAVAFFVNRSMGMMVAMVGSIMIGFAAASQFYMKEIAQFGAFLLVGLIVFGMVILVRSMINAQRSSTAVREIVEMIEILKETMTDDEKTRIFGPDGVAERSQSELTKEIIAKIKADEIKPEAVKPPDTPQS